MSAVLDPCDRDNKSGDACKGKDCADCRPDGCVVVCRVKIHAVGLACCGADAAVGRGIGIRSAEQIFYLAVECGRVGVVLCDGLSASAMRPSESASSSEVLCTLAGYMSFSTPIEAASSAADSRAVYEIRVGRYALDLLRFNICKADCGQQDDNYGCNGCDNI